MRLSRRYEQWLRYPAISPDGESILFNHKGNIYVVSSDGGKATPLTLGDSYDYHPVWSNDGESIAFASDRFGNFDVFVMSASGGEAQRLTFHSGGEVPSAFTHDDSAILFSALRQDYHSHVQFPTGVMAELYSVPVMGGRVDQVLTTPAHDAVMNSDGSKLLFHDRKGYENDWRKHHTSAVTRDIWVYDMATEDYSQLSQFNGEDRNPVFTNNDDTFYYLSEESGSFNVHRSSLTNSGQNQQVTSFTSHPVRFLSIADDNTLCFGYHGDLFTMSAGGEPQKVEVQIGFDGTETLSKVVPVNSKFTEATLSPNGKEVAYIFRGEIFVSSLDKGTTKRITNTPYQERSVSFSPDGRSLLYAAEVDTSWNVYTTSIVREEEPYFYLSTLLKEEEVVATPVEEFQPSYSPDGKEVAFLEDRTTLRVINLESKAVRTIMDGSYNYSYADGDQWYQWSPDSKWFLVSFGPKERIFWREVGLVEASGKGEIRNLTKSGYGDFAPGWSRDGKMMVWGSTRQGTRMENGWMNTGDVYGMFFTKESWEKFNLSEEEFEVMKEMEEKKKKEEEKEKEDEKEEKNKKKNKRKKEDKKEDKEEIKPLTFDWDGLEKRKKRLTVHTSNLGSWVLSKDNDKLYYITRFEGKNNIWVTDLRKKETKMFAKLNASGAGMELSKEGDFLLVIADGKLKKVDLKDGKVKPVPTKGEMILKQDKEREYIFEHAWRQVREKFYVEDLQGVDWDFYYKEYKPFLGEINNSYDFTEMLSEMLGELNASHTGSGYRNRSSTGDRTASLGLLYDHDHKGSGLRVAEVLKGGPMDKDGISIKDGDIIEKIDGETIDVTVDFYAFLNRKAGKPTLVSVKHEDGKTEDIVVKPITLGQENQLLYERWVETRRKEVERLSDGRLGYVHVRGMNDASMRVVIEEVLGRHITAEALVVDTRFNGGGNLHDVLSDFLNGKKYMDVIPHGQYIGSEPWNKWTKPSIVVMGESNYSDAHLFPVAYKIKEVGQTLGMPVPGTGTFVWWETQIDPSIYFGIPMGGWRPLGQPFLENSQLEPDIRVMNEPEEMKKGRDQQLEEAVKTLLR